MKNRLFLVLLLSKSLQVFSTFTTDEPNFKLNWTYTLLPPFDQSLTKNWLPRSVSFNKDDTIILTPLDEGKTGSIWNRNPTSTNSWKIVLQYSVFNDAKEVADGIALWYMPEIEQRVYEASHQAYGGPRRTFSGLMIAIDNFRLISKVALDRTSEEAAVIVVYNEYQRLYNWVDEGFDIALGRCVVRNRYRNTTDTIATLAVEYVDDVLKVYHTNYSQTMELCVEVRDLQIPSGYILGVSALTGLYYASHEVHSLRYYNDKRCDFENEKQKLWTSIYITSGFLILVTLILLAILVKYLGNKCHKKHKNDESDRKKCTISVEDNMKPEESAIHSNLASAPVMPCKRDSTNYFDIGGGYYDHLTFPTSDSAPNANVCPMSSKNSNQAEYEHYRKI